MLYDPSAKVALHAWLVRTLEPICDAEPEALSTYIIALLGHEVPEQELSQEVTKQLDEFFENGANTFVDTLFAALRSKSYIPYTSPIVSFSPSGDKPEDNGIPIPLDALITPSKSPDRGTKRNLGAEDREIRGPLKGPRLGQDAYFIHNSPASGYGSSGGWGRGHMEGPRVDYGSGMMNGHGPRPYHGSGGRPMLPRGVCRDYHLKGFCSRGAMCKYSHDHAAFTPQMNMPVGGGNMPFMGIYNGMPYGLGQAYDPNDSLMDMSPPSSFHHGPTMPRPQNGNDLRDHNPARSQESVAMDLTPSNAVLGSHSSGPAADFQPPPQQHPHTPQPPPYDTDGPSQQPSPTPITTPSALRPSRGGNLRGRGQGRRGTFVGDHHSFQGEQGRDSKTLVVEKIPQEHLTLEAVNGWFKRFGTVTNVAVDPSGGKALVSFSTHEEAQKAWAAEEAVFNNRFVKIFWHRPFEGQGAAGSRALQASASLIANMAAREKEPEPASATLETSKQPVPPATFTAPKSKAPEELSSLQSKQQLLERRILEQKELMEKLSTATPEEKKGIMSRLRQLASEMKPPSSLATPSNAQVSNTGMDDKERKKKELLDIELDMHTKITAEAGAADGDETSENLQEKLTKLQAEAKALGIPDGVLQSHPSPYRGFRSRGRGRASFRGAMRGGPPRVSMKLDNRTKTLLVTGISSQHPGTVQAVRSWYEAGGQMASFDVHDDTSLIVKFLTRAAAEQALSKGMNIPSVGVVRISWYNETSTPKVPSQRLHADAEKKSTNYDDDRPASPRQEELLDETGWGNEDSMGMF